MQKEHTILNQHITALYVAEKEFQLRLQELEKTEKVLTGKAHPAQPKPVHNTTTTQQQSQQAATIKVLSKNSQQVQSPHNKTLNEKTATHHTFPAIPAASASHAHTHSIVTPPPSSTKTVAKAANRSHNTSFSKQAALQPKLHNTGTLFQDPAMLLRIGAVLIAIALLLLVFLFWPSKRREEK